MVVLDQGWMKHGDESSNNTHGLLTGEGTRHETKRQLDNALRVRLVILAQQIYQCDGLRVLELREPIERQER